MWEEAVRELATLTATDADFKIVGHRDTASFILEDAVLFRVKHADVSLTTAQLPDPRSRSTSTTTTSICTGSKGCNAWNCAMF